MKVRAQFFAQLRDVTGVSEKTVELPERRDGGGFAREDLRAHAGAASAGTRTFSSASGVEFVDRNYALQPDEDDRNHAAGSGRLSKKFSRHCPFSAAPFVEQVKSNLTNKKQHAYDKHIDENLYVSAARRHFGNDAFARANAENGRKIHELHSGPARKGHFIAGEPLEETGKILSGERGRKVTDGPFTESKEAVGGYFVIRAKDLDEAVELSRACPILANGGEIEVRPIQKIPGM